MHVCIQVGQGGEGSHKAVDVRVCVFGTVECEGGERGHPINARPNLHPGY